MTAQQKLRKKKNAKVLKHFAASTQKQEKKRLLVKKYAEDGEN